MSDDVAEMLNEIIQRIEKIEENQKAFEGAVQAFITVFAVRRLPEDSGGQEGEHL